MKIHKIVSFFTMYMQNKLNGYPLPTLWNASYDDMFLKFVSN